MTLLISVFVLSEGIDVSTIERDRAYRTPTKTRILAGGIHPTKLQVVRIDGETHEGSDGRVRGYLERYLAESLPRVDVVMVSDYSYRLIFPVFGLSVAKRTASMAYGQNTRPNCKWLPLKSS